jgi:hypothetical protein
VFVNSKGLPPATDWAGFRDGLLGAAAVPNAIPQQEFFFQQRTTSFNLLNIIDKLGLNKDAVQVRAHDTVRASTRAAIMSALSVHCGRRRMGGRPLRVAAAGVSAHVRRPPAWAA